MATLAWRSRAGALPREQVVFALALAALVAAGLALRLLAARHGFLGDELFTYVIADRESLGDVIDGVRTTENTPPLYYVLAWVTLELSGVPELVRLPSILAGAATIAVAGLVARRIAGDRAGLFAAALMAVSPFAVYYSSEARSYAPAAFAVLLSTWLLLRALGSSGRLPWVWFAISVATAVWFHYTAVFPLAAQFAWALATQRQRRGELVVAHAGAVALYVPWLPFAGTYVPIGLIAPLAPLTVERVFSYPVRVLLGHPIAELGTAPGTIVTILLALALVGLAVLALRGTGRGKLPPLGNPRVLLLLMALAAPAGILAYSLLESSIWLPRNLLVSAPAAVVLAGVLVAPALRARAGVALAAVALLLLLPSAFSTATGDLARPPYDEVARLIDERARPGDPVIEGPLFLVERELSAPLRRPLLTFLTRPHPLYLGDDPGRAGWRAARRAGRALVVYPDVYTGAASFLVPTPPAGSGLVPVDRRTYEGTPGLVYVEYARR